jgi:hypothetical protein
LGRRLSWAQGRSGCCQEETNLMSLSRIEHRPVCNLATIQTVLSGTRGLCCSFSVRIAICFILSALFPFHSVTQAIPMCLNECGSVRGGPAVYVNEWISSYVCISLPFKFFFHVITYASFNFIVTSFLMSSVLIVYLCSQKHKSHCVSLPRRHLISDWPPQSTSSAPWEQCCMSDNLPFNPLKPSGYLLYVPLALTR